MRRALDARGEKLLKDGPHGRLVQVDVVLSIDVSLINSLFDLV